MNDNLNPKDEREKKLYELSAICFAAHELNLYLDLHPEDKSMFMLFNDYTKPLDKIVESVLFTNVGNHKKDKSYKLAITKKGEKLYRDFIINEVDKNRNAYEEAKSNFENSLLGTTATIGGIMLNKKYNVKGKVAQIRLERPFFISRREQICCIRSDRYIRQFHTLWLCR